MSLILRVARTAVQPVATYSRCELWDGGICKLRAFGIEHSPVRMAPGQYEAKRTRSPRFSEAAGHDVITWEIMGVMDGDRLRSGLRIHADNYASTLDGCLALGTGQADINGDGIIDITNSKKAIALFEQACGAATDLQVIITDPT